MSFREESSISARGRVDGEGRLKESKNPDLQRMRKGELAPKLVSRMNGRSTD